MPTLEKGTSGDILTRCRRTGETGDFDRPETCPTPDKSSMGLQRCASSDISVATNVTARQHRLEAGCVRCFVAHQHNAIETETPLLRRTLATLKGVASLAELDICADVTAACCPLQKHFDSGRQSSERSLFRFVGSLPVVSWCDAAHLSGGTLRVSPRTR
jgi:hypothetical protein